MAEELCAVSLGGCKALEVILPTRVVTSPTAVQARFIRPRMKAVITLLPDPTPPSSDTNEPGNAAATPTFAIGARVYQCCLGG